MVGKEKQLRVLSSLAVQLLTMSRKGVTDYVIYNAIVGWPFSLLCIHIEHPWIGVHIFFRNVHSTENWSKFSVNGLNIILI